MARWRDGGIQSNIFVTVRIDVRRSFSVEEGCAPSPFKLRWPAESTTRPRLGVAESVCHRVHDTGPGRLLEPSPAVYAGSWKQRPHRALLARCQAPLLSMVKELVRHVDCSLGPHVSWNHASARHLVVQNIMVQRLPHSPISLSIILRCDPCGEVRPAPW